jgi:ribosomal protein S21
MIFVRDDNIEIAIRALSRELTKLDLAFELLPHTYFCSKIERKKMKLRRNLRRKKRRIKKLEKKFAIRSEGDGWVEKQRARYGPLIRIKKD